MMMQCFSVFQMHWPGVEWGGVFLLIPAVFWPAILAGLAAGLICAWKPSDLALTFLTLALVSLTAFLHLLLITYMTNPPYCWGDVLGPREWQAIREPRLGSVVFPVMAGNAAIFTLSFVVGVFAKLLFRRHFTRPAP